jgi:hypothetical protein
MRHSKQHITLLENKSILYTFPIFLITRYKFRYDINFTDVNYPPLLGIAA